MPYNAAAKKAAKEYVARIRAATVCARCGKQPIEWHNSKHEASPNTRVSGLAMRGHPIERIQQEIDESEPLCRRCHMRHDGRSTTLTANKPLKKGMVIVEAVPCSNCGTLTKPRWKEQCRKCYDQARRSKAR